MIIALPWDSFLLLLGIPTLVLLVMLVDCWRILTRRKE